MNFGAFGRSLGRMVRRPSADHRALARRIEERANFVSAEAHAYVDHRISAFKGLPAETDRQIEARARLASQEAKAYADDAIHSLSMALRAVTKVLAGATRRIDAFETGQSEMNARLVALDESLAQATGRLETALEHRSRSFDDTLGTFAVRIDESAETSRQAQERIGKINDGFLDLGNDVAGVETALREIDAQLARLMREADLPGRAQAGGLRAPTAADVASARAKK
jgi:chromosome segregation ATPase